MTRYHEFTCRISWWNPRRTIRAFVAERDFDVAIERLQRDDPCWKNNYQYVGAHEFDETKYRCRPRTRPFIAMGEDAR